MIRFWLAMLAITSSTTLCAQPLIPYQADYSTEWTVGWFTIDIDAQRSLKQLDNGDWQLTFRAETGAAALTETSVARWQDDRLWPLEYRYRASGLFNENDRSLDFDREQQRVTDLEQDDQVYDSGWISLDDDGPILAPHDNLTYMQQAAVDLATGNQKFGYAVFEKNKSKPFRFAVVGEETLQTAIGPVDTIKVQQLRRSNKRQIYAWFSKQHNYTLVRLVDKKDGKKRYQIDLQSIEMQMPEPEAPTDPSTANTP